MTNKELIKQEIERQYNCEKCYPLDREVNVTAAVLQELLLFIDSLPEEHASEDLNEAANEFGIRQGVELKPFAIKFFTAGAQWQRKKDQQTIELAEDHAILAGMDKMRKEMMKDAVIAWVNTYESVTNPYDNEVSFITNLSPSKFKNKETVKIIIVKGE